MWSKVKYYLELIFFLYKKQSIIIRYFIIFFLVVIFLNLLFSIEKSINLEFLQNTKYEIVEKVESGKDNYKECLVGRWNVTHSQIMGGYKISNDEFLTIYKKDNFYLYDLDITTIDEMYGGTPKYESYSGKMSNDIIENKKLRYLSYCRY